MVLVRAGQTIYWGFFRERGPLTAVFQFIHGTFSVYRDQSFFILRNRIYLCGRRTAFCSHAVKVCAKRLQVLTEDEVCNWMCSQPPEVEWRRIPAIFDKPGFAWPQKLFIEPNQWKSPRQLIELLAHQAERSEILHDSNWPIGAAAFLSGRLLSVGRNQSFAIKTQHAEVQMVLSWYLQTGQRLPRGTEVWVTHKPCRMCAALLIQWSDDGENIKVRFFQDVRGGLSSHSLLPQLEAL